MKSSRVFWFAPINVAAFESRLSHKLFMGAAARKVMNLLAALRCSGVSAVAVLMPHVGRGSSFRWFGAQVSRDKAPVLRLSATTYPLLNRALAAVGYLWIAIRWVGRSDTVVLYNFYPEYVPACVFLRLFKNPAFLEVEDFPLAKLNLREIAGRASYKVIRFCCHARIIAVSRSVAEQANSTGACIIQGVVSSDDTGRPTAIPDFVRGLRIQFGGTLVRDTGSELFRDTVKWLREYTTQARIEFLVTGFGDLGEISDLQEGNAFSSIKVELKADLDPNAYRSALRTCHASLSLKDPNSDFGATTFPSKAIEIAGNGLLLISTRVSDLPEIFDGAAVFIDRFSGDSLGRALLWVLENEAEAKRLASIGFRRAHERFSYESVSSQLLRLFEGSQNAI